MNVKLLLFFVLIGYKKQTQINMKNKSMIFIF
jgi:hypothetical protein